MLKNRNDHDLDTCLPELPIPCPNIESAFEIIRTLGRGSYGSVYLARCKKTSSLFAIKKIRNAFLLRSKRLSGFPTSTIREIRILKFLNGLKKTSNVWNSTLIELKGVLFSQDMQYTALVFEYMEYDLYRVLRKANVLRQEVVAYYFHQLLQAVCVLHHCQILHRDIKTSNILINRSGELKLCDFSLAREWRSASRMSSESRPYSSCDDMKKTVNRDLKLTPRVATLYYRAPEVYFGTYNDYKQAPDMWSLGCVLAEMFLCRPLFECDELLRSVPLDKAEGVFFGYVGSLLGTPPSELGWAIDELACDKAREGGKSKENALTRSLKKKKHHSLDSYLLRNAQTMPSPDALDIIKVLLQWDPRRRPTTQEILNHAYFQDTRWCDREKIRQSLQHQFTMDTQLDADGAGEEMTFYKSYEKRGFSTRSSTTFQKLREQKMYSAGSNDRSLDSSVRSDFSFGKAKISIRNQDGLSTLLGQNPTRSSQIKKALSSQSLSTVDSEQRQDIRLSTTHNSGTSLSTRQETLKRPKGQRIRFKPLASHSSLSEKGEHKRSASLESKTHSECVDPISELRGLGDSVGKHALLDVRSGRNLDTHNKLNIKAKSGKLKIILRKEN